MITIIKHIILKSNNIYGQSHIKIACFVRVGEEFINKTDECILQRRNNEGPAPACWYDYKTFLPKASKIKTDDEFLLLANAEKFFRKEEYCQKIPELTTQERKECKEKAKKYIIQLTKKTAPHCRDVISKKYKEFLQESKDFLTMIDNVKVTNAFGQENQAGTFMYQAIYGNAYATAVLEKLQELGYENFCTIEGFEKDMKKMQAKNPLNRTQNIVNLN